MHHGRPLGLRPVPVDAAVDRLGEVADLAFLRMIAVKPALREQYPAE